MRHRSTLGSLIVLAGLLACRDEMPTETKRDLTPRGRPSAVATPVTPINGGLVTAEIIPIDVQTGLKDNVRVNGDLACYGAYALGEIRYYRFSTAVDAADPSGVAPMMQCAVAGNRIVHPELNDPLTQRELWLFDAGTSTSTQLDGQRTASRQDPAIGGNTVAFFDYYHPTLFGISKTELRVVDLASPTPSSLLSSTGGIETLPNVSPDGNLIVWEGADAGSITEVKKAVRTAGVWSGALSVTTTPTCAEGAPDTDGQYIVWSQYCAEFGDGDLDVYFQSVSGGPVSKLNLSGHDFDARIDGGVIVFIHVGPDLSQEVMVYTIATNTLLQVTNAPDLPKVRPDVSVLSGGNIRVVWATLPPDYDNVIQGVTFTPTGGPVGSTTFTFGGFGGSLKAPPALNTANAGATVALHFSLGGDYGLNIFAQGSPSSVEVDCKTLATIGTSAAAVGQGGSPLAYSAATGLYTFKWSTSSSWKGTCRKFTAQFTDNSSASVIFQFKPI